jgi:hypothetical protein
MDQAFFVSPHRRLYLLLWAHIQLCMNSKIPRKILLTLFDPLSSYLVICAALVSPTLEYGPTVTTFAGVPHGILVNSYLFISRLQQRNCALRNIVTMLLHESAELCHRDETH